jgi:DNA-binding HxlR family transcriptional regulator
VRSYQQYCSVARALDLVGDRWVLLIVRELLAFGPSRYSDLKRGLPGIASNLLAERLRTMEADGLIERREAPAPIGTGVYQLTRRGRGLEGVLRALTRWGLPSMPAGPSDVDATQPQWSALLAALTLPQQLSGDNQMVLGIETGDDSVQVTLRSDGFEIERGLGSDADVTVHGPARLVGGVLSGLLSTSEATRTGLRITGRADLLDGLFDVHQQETGATP